MLVRLPTIFCVYIFALNSIANAQGQKTIRVLDGDTIKVEQIIRLSGVILRKLATPGASVKGS
jgi:hypothetical protein